MGIYLCMILYLFVLLQVQIKKQINTENDGR